MLLTITTTRAPATDLGYLLFKHPGKVQSWPVASGQAHVFYPEATDERCTAALLLEVDPVALVRGKSPHKGNEPPGITHYVNDRPYAASSLLSVALKEVFGTALTGRCDARPELAASPIPLEIRVPALRCSAGSPRADSAHGGGADLATSLFTPLGWTVTATPIPLDPPQWGTSRYVDLRLDGTVRLADALNHLYVLLPVLDDAKHYWVTSDEIDKLVRAGAGWLATHPEKALITRRYLAHRRELTVPALARLAEADDLAPEDLDNAVSDEGDGDGDEEPKPVPLAIQRREAVLAVLRESGARSVGDLGCGDGALTRHLIDDKDIDRVVAADVSARALAIAARRLRLERLPEAKRASISLIQSALTYRDERLTSLDAAVLMEVIEHVDDERLPALERAVFGFAAPASVIVTTPNAEHNAVYGMAPGARRHPDHRWEWTRAQFRRWARRVAATYGYSVRFSGAGPEAPQAGPPTQLAVFTRTGGRVSELPVPELSLVVLVGVSGSGKSTFARAHFKATEVISSDFCRGLVSDDENDQAATADAFDVLNYIAGKRLAAGRLTVVDATNVQAHARQPLVALARAHDALPVAIVLDLPDDVCVRRNADRLDRDFGPQVIRRQRADLRRSIKGLQREGFRAVHVLRTEAQVAQASIRRTKMFSDLRHVSGPFDVIGDVHGCRAELEALLARLGYSLDRDADGSAVNARHPAGRRVIFLGDLVDRGPDTPGVLRLAMGMVTAGTALAVVGNHEAKLLRALRAGLGEGYEGGSPPGRPGAKAQQSKLRVSHGLAESLEQIGSQPDAFRQEIERFLDSLVSHYVLDEGRLVVAHAGLAERLHGRASGRVREFCLYGQTTGETDEYGLPVRYPWAEEYRGRAMVLYGHTPALAAEWVNNTMCLDTGCVFGGALSALQYPERNVVSVPAARVYYEPAKPLTAPSAATPGHSARREPDVLDIKDVTGARVIETSYLSRVSIRPENAAAALEVMSRFAIDPRWLVYLPPTMSPVSAASSGPQLEDPGAAFSAFRDMGVGEVVCEEKHMGSRAVLLVCESPGAAQARFGVTGPGAAWTRTGRPFFAAAQGAALLERARAACADAGLFAELETSWLLLDAEIMPWSAKAGQLLRDQYAAAGAAAHAALPAAVSVLEAAAARGLDVSALLSRTSARLRNADGFTAAYQRYCWPVAGLDGVRVAPFQVLASEGCSHAQRPHAWHLERASRLAAGDPALFTPTRHVYADTADASSCAAAADWWSALTAAGGEGMVVKPAAGLARGPKGLAQPGLKVRGPEYLRIIYGPDYTVDGNLARLRSRSVGRKRSLALREYALGLEALDRLARGEPLWRVHECAFGVLALESEPVDPRL